MKAVLLFPGQGAQKVGMGKDLYDTYPAAKAMMDAGASLVEIYSGFIYEGPGLVKKILTHLENSDN